jgi:Skp family chaperone for outer membrane proteins
VNDATILLACVVLVFCFMAAAALAAFAVWSNGRIRSQISNAEALADRYRRERDELATKYAALLKTASKRELGGCR